MEMLPSNPIGAQRICALVWLLVLFAVPGARADNCGGREGPVEEVQVRRLTARSICPLLLKTGRCSRFFLTRRTESCRRIPQALGWVYVGATLPITGCHAECWVNKWLRILNALPQ